MNSSVVEEMRNNTALEFNSKTWACIQLGEGSSLGKWINENR